MSEKDGSRKQEQLEGREKRYVRTGDEVCANKFFKTAGIEIWKIQEKKFEAAHVTKWLD